MAPRPALDAAPRCRTVCPMARAASRHGRRPRVGPVAAAGPAPGQFVGPSLIRGKRDAATRD